MDSRKIFISYRRADARADAGRLYDRLHLRYADRVFRDVGSLEPGVDWQEAIDLVLASTDAFIVVIGAGWLSAADANGKRRIDDPRDGVRREVASALRSGTRVIPVLVGDARLPAEEDLPEEIRPLVRHNALALTEQDFDADVDKLVKAIERTPGWAPSAAARSSSMWIVTAVAVLAVLAGLYTWRQRGEIPSQSRTTTPGQTPGPLTPDPAPSAPTTAPVRAEPPAGRGASGATASVGQITFKWNGANATTWQVLDADTRQVLKYLSAGAGQTAMVDIASGSYVIAFDGKPDIAPVAVAVSAGQASKVTPPVGQITFKWNGANTTIWQVLDAETRQAIRYSSAGAGQTETLDIGPGSFFIIFDGKPEISPIAVTVTAGQASRTTTPIGQVTFSWRGANPTILQLLDASTRKALRYAPLAAGQTDTLDVAPGNYLVAPGNYFTTLDGKFEFQPVAVTVADGRAARVDVPSSSR